MSENYAYGVYCNEKCVSDDHDIGCFESYEEAKKWIKSLEAVQEHPMHEQDYTIKECELPDGAWEDCYEWPFESVKRGYDIFNNSLCGLECLMKIDCVERFISDENAFEQATKDFFCKLMPKDILPEELKDSESYGLFILDTPYNREAIKNKNCWAIHKIDCKENRKKLGL